MENCKYLDKFGMRFQDRDDLILSCIQEYDGVMAKRQIKNLFWENSSWRAMEIRLAKLHRAGYICWPDVHERKQYPIPEPIVWLGWNGAIYLAAKQGIEVETPKGTNENQMRTLEKSLRSKGFSWLRQPRWSQLKHDLNIIDIRVRFEKGLMNLPFLQLEEWINESVFRSAPDYVDIQITRGDGKVIKKRKGVCPDGMLVIIDNNRRLQNLPYHARFLLEVDMATHANLDFGWEKSVAGAAYIKSKPYAERFGNNLGRWLVITTGETRMKNLMKQTHKMIGKDSELFLFTTFQDFFIRNVFREKIWNQCGKNDKTSLLQE